VLLGITPYSLTPAALATNEFEYRRNWMPFQSITGLYAKQSLRYVHPLRVDKAYDELITATPKAATQAERDREFHDDGWLAMNRYDGREDVYAEHYRASFEGNTVDSEIVEQLLIYVRDWREKGIRVIAFRPPVSEVILSIENENSGFDESAFRAAFEAAGGRWIEIEPTRYVTYDGSHAFGGHGWRRHWRADRRIYLAIATARIRSFTTRLPCRQLDWRRCQRGRAAEIVWGSGCRSHRSSRRLGRKRMDGRIAVFRGQTSRD